MQTDDTEQPDVSIVDGHVRAAQFPLMILTSNGERDFPAPFLRRCLRLEMPNPTGNKPADDNAKGRRLLEIMQLHFSPAEIATADGLIRDFLGRLDKGDLGNVATDQLLNAVHFVVHGKKGEQDEQARVIKVLTQELTSPRG